MAEENKTNNNRKANPDPFNPEDGSPRSGRPRFNIYWVYGLIFAVIVGYNLFRGVSSAGVEINQLRFVEMVKQGDVEKIKTIRNKKLVRVFLKKDALQKRADFFKQALESPKRMK